MDKPTAMARALRGLPPDVQDTLKSFAVENGISTDDRDWLLAGLAGLAARTPHDLRVAGAELIKAFDQRIRSTEETADTLREAALAEMKNDLAAAIRTTLQKSGEQLARGAMWKSFAWGALILSVAILMAGGGGYWLGQNSMETQIEGQRQASQDQLDAERQKADARVAETLAQLPQIAAWASGIRSEAQQRIAAWAVADIRTDADRQAAEWGLSPEGRVAQRFSARNSAYGGIRGMALSCTGGTRNTDDKTGGAACQLNYWLVQ